MRRDTELVAFDACPDDPFRPSATPLYQTATFEQASALGFGQYDYSRSGNPTRSVLEAQLARLDGGQRGFAFASGLAALSAVTRLLRPGDELVAADDLYGGTHRLFTQVLEGRGITVRYADLTDNDAAARAITSRTRLVHVESLSNPLLRVPDVRALARLAHARGALLSVDSTALSPYLQRPLELGADVVAHSATKYLCGHGDVIAGALVVNDPELAEQLYAVQNGEGNGLAPFECFLLLRGMKTLAVRLERQQRTAQRVAEFLTGQPGVRGLRYPGLTTHPGHLRHAAQARGAGALLSFEAGGVDAARRIVESLRLFATTVSFGGVNSTASLPCRMSHASIPAEVRRARGLPEDLVRLAIGLEDPDDLIEDLEQALRPGVAQGGRAPAA